MGGTGQYLVILGPYWVGTGQYLVILGHYRLVLVSTLWYWVIVGGY